MLFALIISSDDVDLDLLIGASYTTLPVELFAFTTYDLADGRAAAVAMILFSALSIIAIKWCSACGACSAAAPTQLARRRQPTGG